VRTTISVSCVKAAFVSLKFVEALAATVTVIAYAEFENIIEVDRDRNVIFDFGV